MILFVILAAIVLISLAVVGILFFMLGQEGKKDEKAVPLTDINQIKKELGSGLLEPQKSKSSIPQPNVVPVFEPKVSLPVQQTVVPPPPAIDETYKNRAKELEEDLRNISKKAEEQAGEARQMIETLGEENESLKRQKASLEQAQEVLTKLQTEAAGLKDENTGLQKQLETTNAQVRLLEEQMAAVKIQMGEEISKANAVVTELTQEKEALLAAPKPPTDDVLRRDLETLQAELLSLKQKQTELEESDRKLREMNTHLIEKNEMLQYDLIKARAQSSGLERVSFNYKNQLEDFLKKVDSVQTNNDQLSQVKNRLEGIIEEVKLQNEELVKKDQLSQFELEKNRSRLVNLERECEDLKARMQQNNPGAN